MDIVEKIWKQAKSLQHTLVMPESEDLRILKAADIIESEKLASVILLGDESIIRKKAQDSGVDIRHVTIRNPKTDTSRNEMADMMVEIRKAKGLTKEQALTLLDDRLYFAAMLVKSGQAYGELAGAISATGDVLRPAFQYIKTKAGFSVVSGAFIMQTPTHLGENGMLLFAYCAVIPDPNAQELAEIAVASAETIQSMLGVTPHVAMLSFSTKGSAKHERVDKVIEATRLAKKMAPHLVIDGEIQADAALIENVGKLKCPDSPVAGKANVLVFPSLEVGNIAYKLVQRLGKASAIGPILQGMAAPINDLSRGCSVEDVVNAAAITVCQ